MIQCDWCDAELDEDDDMCIECMSCPDCCEHTDCSCGGEDSGCDCPCPNCNGGAVE